MNLVRQHFVLSEENNKTGALGLRHYEYFSKNKWVLRYFTSNEIEEIKSVLTPKESELIKNLLDSKTGRNALESAWRAKFGWPILCKQ